MPFPFENQRFTFTQPDGTKLEVVGTGDQHHAVFETLDGYTVVCDPDTGFCQYATISQDGDELVPTGARVDAFDASTLHLTPLNPVTTSA